MPVRLPRRGWLLPALFTIACSPNNETTAPAATPSPPHQTKKEAWEDSGPLDLEELGELGTRIFFAQRDTSICPQRSQALDNDCGNSVEDPAQGYVVRKGASVTVVGDERIEGARKTVRFTKAGLLPGWVAAENLASTPDLRPLHELRRKNQQQGLSAWTWARPRRKRVYYLDTNASRIRLPTRGDEQGPVSRVLLVTPDADKEATSIALRIPECYLSTTKHSYLEHHGCLLYGDCEELDFICGPNYCDPFLARIRVSDRGFVDAKGTEYTTFELLRHADRFGTFMPSRMPSQDCNTP